MICNKNINSKKTKIKYMPDKINAYLWRNTNCDTCINVMRHSRPFTDCPTGLGSAVGRLSAPRSGGTRFNPGP